MLDHYQLSNLCDAVQRQEFAAGATIVKEGEDGDLFYLIEEGTASATKGDREVHQYTAGGYFGELALMHNQPRVATVTAGVGGCVCIALGRSSFNRLLGSLESLLKEKEEAYVK